MGDASIRGIARAADIDHNVLRTVLAGDSWPDVITIAKLERTLGPLSPGVPKIGARNTGERNRR